MADVPNDAPQHCPGTSSEEAGKSSACQGCPNQAICSSGAPKAPDPAVEEIKLKMSTVKHKIVVLSGKGGVGKSTFSAHLAHALASDEATEAFSPRRHLMPVAVREDIASGARGRQKHGKWAGVHARLKTNPSRPALPSIILSNVCSLDNKLDYIRLQRTTRHEYRDCCVFVFTEMWLSDRVLDTAIQLDGLTAFRDDRNAALCAYRPLVRRSKPVLKHVKTWPAGVTSALQDRFECTDWNMFREAATNSDSINLEEYTTSVTSYIGKRIDDMTVSKTITTHSNRKPWMNAERGEAHTHTQRIHGHFQDSGDSRRMWQGIQEITNYKTTPSACDSDSSLPDTLNDFYDRFEAQNNVAARKTIPAPNDQVLCLSTADVRRTLCRVNSRKSAGPDNIPGRVLRECAEQLADVFTDIFNISLTSAVVPTCLRTMTIVPVPKKSTVSCLNDYRLVALTPIAMKCYHPHWTPCSLRIVRIAPRTMPSPQPSICPSHTWTIRTHMRALRDHFLLFIDGSPVEIVKSTKFLGVYLAENFTWSLNTSSITKKAQQRLYVRQRLRKANLPPPILTVFYRGTIESVALLDVDICGPSIPRIMGLEGEQVHQSGSGWSPVYVEDNLAVMSIGFLLSSPDDAVIWRGPKKNGMIKQFLRDVDWGELDYLIVDTPPGTSDEHLSVVQYLSGAGIDGAVVITTPQEVSLQDVRKEIRFCQKVKLPIIGVVENMSGFVCPKCKAKTFPAPGNTSQIFPPSTGGAERMCQELSLPLLGRVPLDPRIGRSCDEGKSFLNEVPDSPAAAVYRAIVQSIKDYCASSSASDGNLNTDME
ncbi:hypothetical protein QTP70_023296 [Hemibagrus guttatus]|uniref:Cytosolic Fe-S cluster assembly factor NUBP1 homolog n=1 Tax=Hemibagrus guttatus TaxID=175788 RepID=A0AAE0QHQ2_9TELE|nr:hypothetical protein QTP70_023296 [Hemibagrus guttatus]